MLRLETKLLGSLLLMLTSFSLGHENIESELILLDISNGYNLALLAFLGLAMFGITVLLLGKRMQFVKRLNIELVLSMLAIAIFLNMLSWYWDGWWHVAIGRHTLFSPPHVLIYVFFSMGLVLSLVLFKQLQERVFKYLFISQVATLYGGFLDIAWHGYFGEEPLISIAIVWAPPHLFSFLITLVADIALLHYLILKYKNKTIADSYAFMRIIIVSGAVFSLLRVLIFPLEPLGWHAISGFSGAFITICITLIFLLYVGFMLPKTGIVLLSMLIFISFVGFEAQNTAPYLTLPPHAQPPYWLHYLAAVLGVSWLDLFDLRKVNLAVIGLLSGLTIYVVYVLFWDFIESSDFAHSFSEASLLVLLGGAGGTCSGLILTGIKNRYLVEK